MWLRALTLAGGLTGAAGLSQFPEFSQQYAQRLGGAADEVARLVETYRADARAEGLSLQAYLAALSAEGPRAATQADNIRDVLNRHDRLQAALNALEGAGPFMRARLATHLSDRDIASRALQAYKPAVPATFEGAVFAGTGFAAGWGGIALLVWLLRGLWGNLTAPFRRKPAARIR